MKNSLMCGIIILMLFTVFSGVAYLAPAQKPENLLIWNADALYNARQQSLNGSLGKLQAAVDVVKSQADAALKDGPFSVVNKKSTPPSGDKHDYTSIGIYWWPNPNTPDGKPYIRKDGQVNPEVDNDTFDSATLSKMSSDVQALNLGYYLTGNEAYAAHAAKLIKVWFIDPATKMNPNLNFGQYVPGVNDGRKEGIVETLTLINLAETTNLLVGSPSFTTKDMNDLKTWYKEYLNWLLTSKIGKDEGAAKNNHGTWYDFQVAAYAIYSDQKNQAKQIIQDSTKRIDTQIEPDGKMPLEMDRTRSVHYHLYNLRAFISLAILGDSVGVDLWHYQTPDGRSIRKTLDFLTPFLEGKQTWPGQQINKQENESSSALYYRYAALRYHDPKYVEVADVLLGKDKETSRINLFFPEPNLKN